MTAKALNRIRKLDDAAEQAGGYVMDPAQVKHDPQKEQDFMMLRRYCIVNRRKMSELTADDFRYVTPPTEQDLAYTAYFREVCKRYNIDFATADADEREFVMRMADKGFLPKRA